MHPVQVRQCKKKIQEQAKTLFEGKRGPRSVAAHIAPNKLYGEIGRLTMELDWLGGLLVGLTEYAIFYNGEQPHQSLKRMKPH